MGCLKLWAHSYKIRIKWFLWVLWPELCVVVCLCVSLQALSAESGLIKSRLKRVTSGHISPQRNNKSPRQHHQHFLSAWRINLMLTTELILSRITGWRRVRVLVPVTGRWSDPRCSRLLRSDYWLWDYWTVFWIITGNNLKLLIIPCSAHPDNLHRWT